MRLQLPSLRERKLPSCADALDLVVFVVSERVNDKAKTQLRIENGVGAV